MICFGESFGFFFGIKLTDRFGGGLKGGIVTTNYDLRDDGDDFFVFAFFGESVIDGLGEPITDLALTHGDCSF